MLAPAAVDSTMSYPQWQNRFLHFPHLRGADRAHTREQRSFYEASHLDGDIDTVMLIRDLVSRRTKTTSKSTLGIPESAA